MAYPVDSKWIEWDGIVGLDPRANRSLRYRGGFIDVARSTCKCKKIDRVAVSGPLWQRDRGSGRRHGPRRWFGRVPRGDQCRPAGRTSRHRRKGRRHQEWVYGRRHRPLARRLHQPLLPGHATRHGRIGGRAHQLTRPPIERITSGIVISRGKRLPAVTWLKRGE